MLLWRSRARWLGLLPFAAGAAFAIAAPVPDLLITGDGRHLAVRGNDGRIALLRLRTGDYIRDLLAERSGERDPPVDLDSVPGARCGRDMCLVSLERGGRVWQVAATRSAYPLSRMALIETCRVVDIVVSERRLPRNCTPRWLKLDKAFLARSGGLAISLSRPQIETVFDARDDHPWRRRARRINSGGAALPAGPAPAPGSAHSAAADTPGLRDRAGSSSLRGGNI